MKYLILLAVMLFPVVTHAEGGVVAFIGTIRQGSCNHFIIKQELHSICYQNGEWQQHRQPFADLNRKQSTFYADTYLTWLDSQQKNGVITISLR